MGIKQHKGIIYFTVYFVKHILYQWMFRVRGAAHSKVDILCGMPVSSFIEPF